MGRLLVDTNIFLEILLEQGRANEARALLSETESYEFFITDYSFHSIGLILLRRARYQAFQVFVRDMVLSNVLKVISLPAEDMESVLDVAQRFNLDYDDAYQYVSAEKYGLTLVSFDSDFDRTERGRKTPANGLM